MNIDDDEYICPECQSKMIHINDWKTGDIVQLTIQCMVCGKQWREKIDLSD